MQKYFCDKSNNDRRAIENSNDMMELQPIELQEGKTLDDFPVLKRFCIPLETFWLNGLLRDIVKLSRSISGGGIYYISPNIMIRK
jgi:hypothetical protein